MHQQPVTRADKRLDLLMKKQEGEHQHLISSHQKEMQALRDDLRLAMQKFEAICQRNDEEIKTFQTFFLAEIGFLKVKIETNEFIIASQGKAIEELHRLLQESQVNLSSKEDVEKHKKSIEENISQVTNNHLLAFQDCQRQCKDLFISLKDEFSKMRNDMQKALDDIQVKGEQNYALAKLDKEGIEREILRYKKAAFYIEKKIENIYTLIERLNKRGAACPKPE